MATLQALSGNVVYRVYEILEPSFLLGRSHQNHVWDIFGKDDRVSRFHAQIDRIGNEFVLKDKGHNPTCLNKVPLTPDRETAVLSNGDIISVCPWRFRFCDDSAVPVKSGSSVTKETQDVLDASSVEFSLNVESDGSSASHNTTSAAVRLKALLGVLTALGRTLDLEDLLTGLLAEVLKVFPAADTCLVSLRQPDGSMRHVALLNRSPGKAPPHLSQTIVAEVFRTKQAILYSDRHNNPEFVASYSFREVGIRSAMCVPLLAEGEVVGVLQVDMRQTEDRFRKDDLEVLTSVAPLINLAIRHSQMHQRLLLQRTLEYELAAAQKVQRSFLPGRMPAVSGYEFFAYYNAALLVGGDYYDYIWLPDGRLAIVLADASGKGTSAALYMSAVSGELKCGLYTEKSAALALDRLNRWICDNPDSRIVTLVMAVLDPATHAVTLLNAGHPAPFLRRANGKIEEAGESSGGLPLGTLREESYQELAISLEAKESLLMFTDGFTDAENSRGERYDKKRVQDQAGVPAPNLSELGRQMVRDAHDFMGMHPQYDDMCLTCFGRIG